MKSAKQKRKPGLYANIQAKRERIKSGSGEKMRKHGAQGAPSDHAFADSEKTAKGHKKKPRKKPAAKKKSTSAG